MGHSRHNPGWPDWVDRRLDHLHLRVHYLEMIVGILRHGLEQSRAVPSADRISVWKELGQVIVALATLLRWIFGILVIVALAFKLIAVSDLPLFRFLAGG